MASILKKLNQNLPEPIMKLFGPVIRGRLINNPIFKDEYNKLINKDIDDLDEYHLSKINDLLKYVKKYVPYYRENDAYPTSINSLEDMKELPLITSDTLREYDFRSEEEMKYYEASTGGTIGAPLKIYQAMDGIYKERAYIYDYMRTFGYDYKTSKLVNFRAPSTDGTLSRYNPLYNEYILNPFFLNSKTFKEYAKVIRKFKPDYCIGYPSCITTYAKLAKNQGFDYQFKAVLFVSEQVMPDTRAEIERLLNTKTYAYYGHTERAVFAGEIDGNYVFNEQYSYTEMLESDVEGAKEIVATGYLNPKMPLIRYQTDDLVYEENGKTKIKGRRKSNEHIYNKLGDPISTINTCLGGDMDPNILAYQIIQKELGVVEIVIENDLGNKPLNDFETLITKLLGEEFDITYTYKPVKRTVRGKLVKVKQEIDIEKLESKSRIL